MASVKITSRRRRSTPKQYACHFCPKICSQPHQLKNHFRRHTGELLYRCRVPDCSRKFKWRSSQRHHQLTKHSSFFPKQVSAVKKGLVESDNTEEDTLGSMEQRSREELVRRDGNRKEAQSCMFGTTSSVDIGTDYYGQQFSTIRTMRTEGFPSSPGDPHMSSTSDVSENRPSDSSAWIRDKDKSPCMAPVEKPLAIARSQKQPQPWPDPLNDCVSLGKRVEEKRLCSSRFSDGIQNTLAMLETQLIVDHFLASERDTLASIRTS